MKQFFYMCLIFMVLALGCLISKSQIVEIVSSPIYSHTSILGCMLSNQLSIKPFSLSSDSKKETVVYKTNQISVSKLIEKLGINIIDKKYDGNVIKISGVSKLLNSQCDIVNLSITRDFISIEYLKNI